MPNDSENKNTGNKTTNSSTGPQKYDDDLMHGSVERLKAIFEVSPYAMGVTRIRDSLFVEINPAAWKMFNYGSREEMVGRSVMELDLWVDVSERAEMFRIIWEAGRVINYETTLRKKDGTVFAASMSCILFLIKEEKYLMIICEDISSLAETRKTLRKSEERYRLLADNIADILWIFDINTRRTTYISPSVQKMRGYTPEEIMNSSNMLFSLTEESKEFTEKKLPELIEDFKKGIRKSYTYTIEQPIKTGSPIWAESTIRFMYNEENGHLELYGVSRDITERISAHKQLNYHLELESLVANISAEFVNADKDNIDSLIVSALEKMARFAGAERGMLFILSDETKTVSNTHEWCKDPADSQKDIKQDIPLNRYLFLRKKLLNNEPMVLTRLDDYPPDAAAEREWITQHGFCSVLYIPVLSKNRRFGTIAMHSAIGAELEWPEIFQQMLKFVGDIIAGVWTRVQAEKKLIRSEYYLKKTQGLAHIGNWIWYKHTNRLEGSDEMLSIFGIDKETVSAGIAAVIDKTVHPEDRKLFEQAVVSLRKHQKPVSAQVRVIRPDNSIRHVWIEVSELAYDKNGHIENISGYAQDITEIKQLEEERFKLENQINQNQRLESLGILAGGIAHDFNNLLGGIFGFIQLAKAESRNKNVKYYLGKALEPMERARHLTGQLLTFSKGGAPVRKPGRLFPFVKDTAIFALSGSNVTCEFNVPDDLSPANFDKNQIGQVIDNLVINALQAMPGGGKLCISAANILIENNEAPVLNNGEYIKLSVKDTGTGIPREIINQIFDPFFSTKPGGSGLGLSTCFSIIKQHQGIIEAESEPGSGAVFHIYLPAVHDALPEIREQTPAGHKGSGTILVMDDDEYIREITEDILENTGYSVITAKDGKEALDLFNKSRKGKRNIRAVILDLTVPGGTGGIETGKSIRRIDRDIPVFISSGYSEGTIFSNPEDYGFNGRITKPFTGNELIALLDKHLKK